MTKTETTKIVEMLLAAYPSGAARATGETQRVYERMLQDLDYQAVQRAVVRLIRSSKWLPTVAEVRESTLAITDGETRPGGEAWGDVITAIRRIGSYGTPRFNDPIVSHIVERWGWKSLCLEGDETADRARFIALYDSLAARQRAEQVSGVPVARQLGGLDRGTPKRQQLNPRGGVAWQPPNIQALTKKIGRGL